MHTDQSKWSAQYLAKALKSADATFRQSPYEVVNLQTSHAPENKNPWAKPQSIQNDKKSLHRHPAILSAGHHSCPSSKALPAEFSAPALDQQC